MKHTLAIFLSLTSLALFARTLVPVAAAAGPAGVLDLSHDWFAAIDAGDERRATALLAQDERLDRKWGARPCTLFLDVGGARSGRGRDAAGELLAEWVRESARSGPWRTEIDWSRSECASGDVGYAVLELRRVRAAGADDGGTDVRRYRATLLAAHRGGRWLLHHAHVDELR